MLLSLGPMLVTGVTVKVVPERSEKSKNGLFKKFTFVFRLMVLVLAFHAV